MITAAASAGCAVRAHRASLVCADGVCRIGDDLRALGGRWLCSVAIAAPFRMLEAEMTPVISKTGSVSPGLLRAAVATARVTRAVAFAAWAEIARSRFARAPCRGCRRQERSAFTAMAADRSGGGCGWRAGRRCRRQTLRRLEIARRGAVRAACRDVIARTDDDRMGRSPPERRPFRGLRRLGSRAAR